MRNITGSLGVILCLLYSTLLFATAPDTLWTKVYGGTSYDRGYSVQQTTDNGYIIAGETGSFGAGGYDVWLLKTDANGDTLWTKTYGSADYEEAASVQQTTDGGYVIVGYTYALGNYDIYLIKTDANGDTLWTRIYGGTGHDEGKSVQQTTDNGYIVVGYVDTLGGFNSDLWLLKTDANGDTLWTKTYGGADIDRGYSVQQTTDNGYIITGRTRSFGAGRYDVWLLKTDANGDTLWTKTYGEGYEDSGWSVQQTADNGYIIVGIKQSLGVAGFYWDDVWLLKTDANGDTLWTKTYGGPVDDVATSVDLTTDNGYIIGGWRRPYSGGYYEVYLVKTDANGDSIWSKTFGGTRQDQGYSVQQTTDNGYIIAGCTRSFGAGRHDVYLIKIEPDLPAFVVTPTSIDFGNVAIDSSKIDSVTVTNTGSAMLDIASVESDNATFMITPNTGNIAPDSSTQFYITFVPMTPGMQMGNIIFTHNAMTSPDTITATGTGTIEATIDIDPDVLNLQSLGVWITCYIELPEGYSVEDIDKNTVALTAIDGESLEPPLYREGPIGIGDEDEDGIPDLMVKFDRQNLIDILSGIIETPADVELTVIGELADGTTVRAGSKREHEAFALYKTARRDLADDAVHISPQRWDGAFEPLGRGPNDGTVFAGVDTIRVIHAYSEIEGPQTAGEISYSFAFYENYPNPFSKRTHVDYALPKRTSVDIKIYDVSGKLVKTLVSERLDPGYYQVDWRGNDNLGRKVSAGVYFIRMITKDYKSQHKVIFLR